MRNRRLLCITIVLILLFSTCITSFAVPDVLLEDLEIRRRHREVSSLEVDLDAQGLEDGDEVRIIVELEEVPLSEYANNRGMKISEIARSTRGKLVNQLLAEQKALKEEMKSRGIKFNELESFINVLNGFSILTTLEEAKSIERIPGVNSVSIANEYERPVPDLVTSKDIVNAREVWSDLGYNGEGMVVAIIDTGLDPNHRDFVLAIPENAKLQEDEVDYSEFPGTWFTEKVPYGYNYMDENLEILDLGPDASEHGMHVAGTVGANGDEEHDGVKGIAPEAQLLAMKVFGNNPSLSTTYGDIIVKAIDDSVALGADVINMSLGSTASFVDDEDLEQVAIRKAMESGVICAVSAGNSSRFGNGWDNPYTENPDIGVIGSPGLAADTIQVAAIENTHMKAQSLTYVKSNETYSAGYMPAGDLDPVELLPGPQAFVDGGLGYKEELNDVSGKVALVMRGELDFVTKITNAQDSGAIGIIVYNDAARGDALVSMVTPDNHTIPAVFIGHSDGIELLDLEEKYITFTDKLVTIGNPNAGKMSDFTSWGSTPNLDFKPEITAPGGSIWSTAQNNSYQGMSGTSMAAPHVAGGAALVLQRVDDKFDLEGAERVQMAKNLLMSTAIPLGDKGLYNSSYGLSEFNFASPRRQGAGTMDLLAATTTPAIVTDAKTGMSKVALYEMNDGATFTINVENFSDKDITYKLKGTVQTDLAIKGYNKLETQGVYDYGTISEDEPWLGDFPIDFSDDEIVVEAGESVGVDVTIDLGDAVDWYYNAPLEAIFPNGTFIEGFITLQDINDTYPDLNIPYMGFYGDWDEASIIDASVYDENNYSFYGYTSMAGPKDGSYYFLGIDALEIPNEDNIAFSPNGDGIYDTIVPVLSFLRNAREMEINILNEDGEVIRELAKEKYLRKHYYDGLYTPYSLKEYWEWDGTYNNSLAEDGQYYYEINTWVDYDESDKQTLTFPVKVDTVGPVIENVIYDKEDLTLEVIANDNWTDIYLYQLSDRISILSDSLDGKFALSEIEYNEQTVLIVHDFAGNYTIMNLGEVFEGIEPPIPEPTEPGIPGKPDKPEKPEKPPKPGKDDPVDPEDPPESSEPTGPAEGDNVIPTVMVENPEFFGLYGYQNIIFEGYVEDESSIVYLEINGKDVDLIWNEDMKNWSFSIPLSLPDGFNSIDIEAMDSADNNIAFAHKIFIDTTAPVIEMLKEIPKTTKDNTITLKALITDNLPSLKIRVNQNLLEYINPDWSYFEELKPAEYPMEYELELFEGKNTIVIEAEDDAGNITRYQFKLNKQK